MRENNSASKKDASKSGISTQEKRRKAVKNILMAGSAISVGQLASTEWTKPVIESVVLPAHAATSTIGFSISDPVTLSYTCSTGFSPEVLVDITGYINQPIAGINVRLELSWAGPSPSQTPPLILNVVTDASGNYVSPGNNIGFRVTSASVVASLPDFPAAGTDTDTISVNINNSTYYCLPPDD